MEFASIERELFIEAGPDVVFEVVSSPEHIREWWPDEAHYEVAPGATGEIVFTREGGGAAVSFTVVDVRPPELFSFRWTHPAWEEAVRGNSFLVTFTLTPSRGGTMLHMTETGFRERGWEEAVLEQEYQDHVAGWDHFLPRLVSYARRVRARARA